MYHNDLVISIQIQVTTHQAKLTRADPTKAKLLPCLTYNTPPLSSPPPSSLVGEELGDFIRIHVLAVDVVQVYAVL